MKIKTSELIGKSLDWAVAKCEGELEVCTSLNNFNYLYATGNSFDYSTDWSQGGPIIERENLSLAAPNPIDPTWCAMTNMYPVGGHKAHGPTPLIAAMRCYVASKLGKEVEVPDEISVR